MRPNVDGVWWRLVERVSLSGVLAAVVVLGNVVACGDDGGGSATGGSAAGGGAGDDGATSGAGRGVTGGAGGGAAASGGTKSSGGTGGAAPGAASGGGAGKSAGATGGGVGSPVLDCPAYCDALCEAVVECGLDAEDCRVGCAVETPELCNVLSIEPRTCQELVDEASCYTLIGEGGACSQGGLTAGLCTPGRSSLVGPCADRVCSSITNTCEPCTSDEQCASGMPGIPGNVWACQEARCLQVECMGDGDCLFDEKSERCHTETRTCTACTSDDDCNEIDATCVEGRCHACAEDDDCFGVTPMCNTESGRCEACSPANCDMMCDTLDGCIECGDDIDCDTGEACHPFDHVCGQACEGGEACPQGFTCSLQVCVPE